MVADKEAAMSVLNISQIMEILPHRQPMLLIDSVEEIEYGVRAVAKALDSRLDCLGLINVLPT